MLRFKKPEEYGPEKEKVLKNFRLIALSNVAYKTMAANLCRRLGKWLEQNKGNRKGIHRGQCFQEEVSKKTPSQ